MGKTYAVSDIHGVMDLWRQISEYCGPDDTIYFLGDASDRGPQCWTTLVQIYNDPRVKFIKGNHEDMLVKAMAEYFDGIQSKNRKLLAFNGGTRTFESWLEIGDIEIMKEWMHKLSKLPTRLDYINKDGKVIALTHAGFDPWEEPILRDYIWDRSHIYNRWSYDSEDKTEVDESDTINYIIHGHTPFEYIYGEGYNVISKTQFYDDQTCKEEPIHAVRYCDGKKIDIDCGAFFTGKTLLLDLDTFEEIYFKTKLN